MFESSSLSRPAGSLRSVAPPVFSFVPAVIMMSAAPVRSEYSPSRIWTIDESAAPYCKSVTTAFARLRSRLTTTISRATPRRMLDNRQAEPTAPAPITPIFIGTSGYTLALEHVMQSTIPCRTLGRTGERVSAIGLGGWHLGLERVDEPLSVRIIRTAIDRGRAVIRRGD